MMSLLSLMFYCFVVSMSLLFHRLLQFSHSGMNHVVSSTSVGYVFLNHSAITDGFLEFLAGVVIRPAGTAKQTGKFSEVFHLCKIARAHRIDGTVQDGSSTFQFILGYLLLTLSTSSCA